MRLFTFAILFIFSAKLQAQGPNYWVKYFLECTSITDDVFACYNDIEENLVTVIRGVSDFNPQACEISAERTAEIASEISTQSIRLQNAKLKAFEEQKMGAYACLSDKSEKLVKVVEAAKKKTDSLTVARSSSNGNLCEGMYVFLRALAVRADFLLSEARNCMNSNMQIEMVKLKQP